LIIGKQNKKLPGLKNEIEEDSILLLLLNAAYAQKNKKDITLEDIFKKSTFATKMCRFGGH